MSRSMSREPTHGRRNRASMREVEGSSKALVRMETQRVIRLHGVPHPQPQVRQVGFPLDHAYVEQCWAPIIGPTSVLLLRRLPVLWREAMTAEVDVAELAQSLGLGNSTGRNGMMQHTLERLERFRFAAFSGSEDLEVFTEAPPLSSRHLGRLPGWTVKRHEHLLGVHLDELARLHSRSDLTARLDRLSQPRTPTPPSHVIAR